MISLARAGPTSRTKRAVEAVPSGTPRSTPGIQNSASAPAPGGAPRARRGPDEPDEARRRGRAERDAEVHLGDPELGLGRRPAEVAGEREPPAAADRVAVDARDRRLLEALEERVRALEEPAKLALGPPERPPALLGRHPRAERRGGAGREDRRGAPGGHEARRRVVPQLGERPRQLGEHRVAQ